MINVKGTIYSTLKTAFNNMRFLGQNNPRLLKKIMFLIVLDDIYDWSEYLEENQSIQKRLQEMRTQFILCNPEFEICRFPFIKNYVNVNTPQTNSTWKRIWDDPDTVWITSEEEPVTPSVIPEPWIPDPNCTITTVYFGGSDDEIKADIDGKPDIRNINELTVCEKMNIYINRETGIMYYLTPDCEWRALNGQGIDEQTAIALIRTHRGKINRTWKNDAISLEIVDETAPAESDLELLTADDLEEMV